jgi:hypothetical protein
MIFIPGQGRDSQEKRAIGNFGWMAELHFYNGLKAGQAYPDRVQMKPGMCRLIKFY